MTTQESKYLAFLKVISTSRTHTWLVKSRTKGATLGHVKWYGAWFQYAFFPAQDTIFDSECLSDIQSLLDRENEKRRDVT